MKTFHNLSVISLICMFMVIFQLESTAQSNRHIPGDLIIMLEIGHDADEFLRHPDIQNMATSLSLARTLAPLSNIHLFRYDGESIGEGEVLRIIRGISYVRGAQLNHFVQERALPNDPLLGSQWHHTNIDSELAWDITTGGTTAAGDDIVVCVIEGGGSNYNHPDLIANHWTNENEIPGNGVDDDGNGFIDDYNGWNAVGQNDNIGSGGHGTSVSGMIGAKGNNGFGGVGVNWDVKIMQVKVGSLNEANVIAAYSYPQQMRTLYNSTSGQSGAFVVATNASWGIDRGKPSNYPVWCAYYDDLGQAGILNCGATSNNNVNVDVVGDMPTACAGDYMVSVTATNSSDQRTFSAYGATTIDLAAPGDAVYLPSGSSGYSSTSGTSFASPCVAAAIALIYSAPCYDLASLAISDPQGTADLVRGYIFDGVDPVASLVNKTVTGGRLNVKNSLDLAMADCGPPPSCLPESLSAVAECAYNESTQSVEPRIVLTADLSSGACQADTLCFTSVSTGLVCIPLTEGQPLNNDEDYILTGLENDTEYTIWYTVSGNTSDSVMIMTQDCALEVAGCTDPTATNYNASATIDNGLCDYLCTDVSLTIETDCWGGEVSWKIRDANGAVVASIAPGTYGDETSYSWSDCLLEGCYTFTIYDSYGDGMNGSSYPFCSVDGDYFITGGGDVLVQMESPDYGSSQIHTFCVGGDIPPCSQPYPEVSGLTSQVEPTGVQLNWVPIPGSIGCQVQGAKTSGGPTQTITINIPEADGTFISQNALQSGQEYKWRVRCGCSKQPLIVGPWSPFNFFNWSLPQGIFSGRESTSVTDYSPLILAPNPVHKTSSLIFSSEEAGEAMVEIIDVTGKILQKGTIQQISGINEVQYDFSELPSGIYILRLSDASSTRLVRFANE